MSSWYLQYKVDFSIIVLDFVQVYILPALKGKNVNIEYIN